jgi:hypothetical protein
MDPLKIDHVSFSANSTFVYNGSSKAMDPPKIDPASFSTTPPAESHGKLLINFLISHPSVQFIQYQWQDLSGILRARIVTKIMVLNWRPRTNPYEAHHAHLIA